MLVLLLTVIFVLGQYSECVQRTYEGCYADNIDNRALGKMLFSERKAIDWSNWNTFSCNILDKCANKAAEAGYSAFGIVYYGECWAGDGDYTMYGEAANCITENWNNPGHCHIGKQQAIAVYTISCASGWQQFGENCYKENTECLSFQDAEDYCVSQGGHLASIHSEDENDFVSSFPAGTGLFKLVWIGLNDRAVENTFVWTDGTATDYTNWASYEPNNILLKEHCVAMTKFSTAVGHWFDTDCDLCKVSVCKRPIG